MTLPNPRLSASLAKLREHWVRLLFTGLFIASLGVLAMLSPSLFRSFLLDGLGLILISVSIALTVQWFMGRRGDAQHASGGLTFFLHVILLAIAGILLMNEELIARRFVAILLGALTLADGIVELIIAWPVLTLASRIGLLISAGASCVVGLLAIIFSNSESVGVIIAYLLGVKLTIFGAVLVVAAWSTRPKSHQHAPRETNFAYGIRAERPVTKKPGELYAVFIGNAFHLGVYVGNDEVVDYRDDNLVHLVTWEQFLLGRQPQHWQYPDINAVSPDEVVETAKNAVGKTFPYKFFEFNCEHFAVWCKSGGKSTQSRYTQVAVALTSIKERPLLGTFIQLYTRVIEWLAFHIGGTFGKRAAFAVRRFSSDLTNWLLSRYLIDDISIKEAPQPVEPKKLSNVP